MVTLLRHSTDVNDVIYVELFILSLVYVECNDLVDTEGKFSSASNECHIVPFVIIQVFIWGQDCEEAILVATMKVGGIAGK